MAKRVATTELNHDNWDKEEKAEEAGTFRKANDSTIQSRIIRQAKRRSASSPFSSTDSPQNMGQTKNVFANFGGFKMSSSTAPTSSNFCGAGATPTNETTNATEVSSSGLKQENDTVTKKNDEASSNRNEEAKDNSIYKNMPKEFFSELKGLNLSVSKWVQTHVERNACCVLSPVFKDYEKHVTLLHEKYGIKKATNATSVTEELDNSDKTHVANKESATPKPFSLNFGGTSSTENFKSGGPVSSAVTTFGKKPEEKKAETDPSHTVASTVPNMFSQSFASPIQPPSGIVADDRNKPVSQFSFSSEKPFTFANVSKPAGSSEENENNKEDSEEPPKADFTPVVEKDAFYSQRCKVFVKKGGSFQERGVGTLFLKPVSNGSKTQLIVRADTSLGNVLLNTLLFQSMPLQRMGSNNVMLVCIPTPEAEPPPIPVLLRVKTAEDADSLLKKLKDYIK